MSMRLFLTSLMLGLSLTACSSLGLDSTTKKLEAVCASAVTANHTIALGVEHGKVNASQQALAIRLGDVIDPVCMDPTAPTLASGKKAAFDAAIAQLLVMAGGVK